MSKCVSCLVCVRLCKECMCVLSKLDSWVEACEGKVGRSYYTRRVPEVSTFQRPGNRTHVEDIKSTSAASRETKHKKTLCQKLLKLILVWLPYYQGPVATLCSHLLRIHFIKKKWRSQCGNCSKHYSGKTKKRVYCNNKEEVVRIHAYVNNLNTCAILIW